jgi:hypothetical protein
MTAESVIADRVAEMHAAMAKEPPNEVMGAFGREQAALAAAGVSAGVAAPGTQLGDADLLDAHGAPTSLHAVTGDGTPTTAPAPSRPRSSAHSTSSASDPSDTPPRLRPAVRVDTRAQQRR